jgi:hypothetical protein
LWPHPKWLNNCVVAAPLWEVMCLSFEVRAGTCEVGALCSGFRATLEGHIAVIIPLRHMQVRSVRSGLHMEDMEPLS